MTDATLVTTPRLRYLDGLRASAAIFVLVHHTMMMAYPIRSDVTLGGPMGLVFGWVVQGHFGVTVFIALAGYSLMLALATKDGQLSGGFWTFMRRRAWRIIPPYWIALALTIVLVVTLVGTPTGTHWDQSLPTDPRGWVSNFFLLQDVLPFRNTAYTFWSVAVEWHIYLLLPLMLFLRRRASWTVAISAGVVIGLVGLSLTLISDKFDRFHFEYYVVFAIAAGGCLVVRNGYRWAKRAPWNVLAASAFGAVIVLCVLNTYQWSLENYPWLDILLGFAVVAALISMGMGRAPRMVAAFAWTPLARLGAYSYSMYLVHAVLLQVVWAYGIQPLALSRGWQLAVGWLVVVPILIAASWVFSLFAERPFVRREVRKRATAKIASAA